MVESRLVLSRRGGGIGRHEGLKIPCYSHGVRVQFPLPAHGAQPKHECVLAVLRHVDGVGIEPSRDEVSFEERKTARDEWRSRE
jgi:hypothetical protein